MMIGLIAGVAAISHAAATSASSVTVGHLAQILDAQLARLHTIEVQFSDEIATYSADGTLMVKADEYYLVRALGATRYAEKTLVKHDRDGRKRTTKIDKYALTPEWTKHMVQDERHPVAQGVVDPPLRGKFVFFDPVFGVFNFGTPLRSFAENKGADVSAANGMYTVTRRAGSHVAEVILIDPNRGFLPVRHSGFGIHGGSVTMEVVSAVEVEDGLWLPTEVHITNIIKNRPEARMEQRFRVKDYTVNKPMSPDALSFTFPRYTEVYDSLSGLKYWVDDPADASDVHPARADTSVVDPSLIQPRPATNRALEQAALRAPPLEGAAGSKVDPFLILVSLGTALIVFAGLLKWSRAKRFAATGMVAILTMLYGSVALGALKAEPPLLELGEVSPDRPTTHTVKITNAGTIPVVVTEILRSCNCSEAKVEKAELGPGETTRLIIRINGKGKAGPFQSKLVLRSDQPGEQTQVVVTGSFRNIGRAEAMPRRIDFGTVGAAQTIERRVMIYGVTNPADLSFASDVSWISIMPEEIVNLRGGGRWYRLHAEAPNEFGEHRGFLRFHPSESEAIEVPYLLEVASDALVQPETLLINTYSGTPVEQQVLFEVGDPKLEIERIETASHLISVASFERSELNPRWFTVVITSQPNTGRFQEPMLDFVFKGGQTAHVRCLAPPQTTAAASSTP